MEAVSLVRMLFCALALAVDAANVNMDVHALGEQASSMHSCCTFGKHGASLIIFT